MAVTLFSCKARFHVFYFALDALSSLSLVGREQFKVSYYFLSLFVMKITSEKEKEKSMIEGGWKGQNPIERKMRNHRVFSDQDKVLLDLFNRWIKQETVYASLACFYRCSFFSLEQKSFRLDGKVNDEHWGCIFKAFKSLPAFSCILFLRIESWWKYEGKCESEISLMNF